MSDLAMLLALIEMLIDKNVITREELRNSITEFYKNNLGKSHNKIYSEVIGEK